ncbi:hypothetical protein FOFC_06158 [Fusarium oxysporum]|jgi:hypothetical protein|nr:hypothetical protein FOFC_06158 [Fusarium oxysporum]
METIRKLDLKHGNHSLKICVLQAVLDSDHGRQESKKDREVFRKGPSLRLEALP